MKTLLKMKRGITYLLFLLSFECSLAQSRIGFVVFPQISSLSSHEIKEDSVNKNKLSFSGGAGITFTQNLSKRIGVQTGLIYSSQNQKIKSVYHSHNGAINIEHQGKKMFDYLKVPVLLRYSFPAGKKMSIVPFAGIQLSYLLKYNGGMVVYGDNFFDLPATPKGNNFYKKTVVDIPLGLNLEYSISEKTILTFGFKFDYALTNAVNTAAVYNGTSLSSYGGFSDPKQRNTTYGVNMGMSFNLNAKKKSKSSPTPTLMLASSEKPVTTIHHHSHQSKKDTVELEGKHHHRHHATHTSNPVASSSRDHVGDMFNKSYLSLIKGVVYKKGTNEVLNNTKIILETEESKVDSSITFIGGTYTLHVKDKEVKHKMYVSRKGYKPLLIDIPDTLLDKHQVSIIKIQLELDGSGEHKETEVVILLKGKVVDAATGQPVLGATIFVKNNIDKTSRQITCDAYGKYSLPLKKYSHYTLTATKGACTSEKLNKSTIEIKESTTIEGDLKINCP
jgi:hypothetical protein